MNMEKNHITHVNDGLVFLGHRIIPLSVFRLKTLHVLNHSLLLNLPVPYTVLSRATIFALMPYTLDSYQRQPQILLIAAI